VNTTKSGRMTPKQGDGYMGSLNTEKRLKEAVFMALLFMALYTSYPAYMTYCDYVRSREALLRRIAVRGRARAVVLYDRVLCGEFDRLPVEVEK